MTSSDFRFWLHGFMEISSRRFFTQRHIITIVDHLKIIDKPDSFINWLEGAFESAHACGGLTSHSFYSLVDKELCKCFEKITPERNPDIVKVVDEVLTEKQVALLKKVNTYTPHPLINPTKLCALGKYC